MRMAVCDKATGRVVKLLVGPTFEFFLLNRDEASQALTPAGDDPFGSYWDGQALVARQAHTIAVDKTTITADGVDAATVSGLPVPCTVYVDGAAVAVADGTFIFKASAAGAYTLTVDEPAVLPWETTINAD